MAVSAKFVADFSSFLDAVKKAESSLNLWQANISKVEGSMKRLDTSFSGRGVIQEATQVAAAIDKIGGASRLTETEQKRVNATITEAIAKYKALGQEAPAHLQNLAKATAQVEQQTSLFSKASSVLSSSFGQFTAANLAATAISKVTSEVGRFIEQGAKLQGVETSFQRLSNGAKQNSEVMLGAMQEGTRGLVSNLDLMTQANKAMLLGLPVTSDAMGELAKTATTLGKAMGQDATTSLNDLITALGRSSPMILDNLGLTVKLGEANEKYAQKIGKTVEELTESEKKMAFYEAAMEAARKKTAELGEQTLTLGERMSKVWTSVENVVTRRVSDMNLVLGKATESWTEFFNFIGDAAQFKSWDELAKKLRPEAKITLPFADPGALARESQAYKDELEQAKKDYDKLKADQKKAEEEFSRNVKENARDRAEATRQSYEETRIALKAYYEMVMKANMGITEGVDGLNFRKSTEVNVLGGLTGEWFKYLDAINAVNSKISLGLSTLPGFALSAEMVGGKFLKAGKDTKTWKTEVDALAKSMTDLAQVAGSSLVSALATLTNGINVGVKAWDSLKKGMDTLTSGGGLKSILSGFTGIISGIGGIVSAAQAAISIGKALFSIFDRDKGRDLVEAFADEFEGGFDEINKYMGMLGEDGARMWKILTQGKEVHSSPEAARRIIDEVRRAIEALRAAASSDISLNIRTIDSTDLEHRGGGEIEGFAGGSKGFRNFGRGTLAMLHGVEAVIRPGDAVPGGGEHVTNVYLDGDVLVRHVERGLDRKYRSRQPVGAAA
ncbi:MAG: hypothetical protein K0R13_2621 [Propionibacteriaceae bacterium]|nr:hypothetical protein [Propionibacteriaceae bacterium]